MGGERGRAGREVSLQRNRTGGRGRGARLAVWSAQRFRRTTDAQAVGASGCLAKPIRPGLLLEAIVRAFNGDSPQEKRAPVVSRFDGSLAERLPLHLLVADDNTVNQKVASMMLK